MDLKFPKWKYRKHPSMDVFQSTLVANADIERELGDSWTDDPHGHGIEVVPYPAEITPGGSLIHHGTHADANGNFAYGPIPAAPGVQNVTVGRA